MNTKSLFAAGLALTLAASALAQDPSSLVGKPAPAFKMTDTKGKVHTNASLKGKVVLMDFWATWCGPCVAASPSMQKLHDKYASKGLVVIGANTYERTNADGAAKKYATEHKYSYTFTKKNDTLAKKLGFMGIPGFVFVDKKGIVRHVQTGWGSELEPVFEKKIKELLAK